MNNNNCFKGIGNLNRCEILTLTNSISMLLSDGLNPDDMNMLGNILNIIGDTITAFAAIPQSGQYDSDNTSVCK